MNNVTLCGNLGKEWEVIQGEYGVIAKNSIAITKKYKKGEDKIERTQWIPLITFGKQAETLKQFTNTGDKLLLTGEIFLSNWVGENGENRTRNFKEVKEIKTENEVSIEELEELENNETIPF